MRSNVIEKVSTLPSGLDALMAASNRERFRAVERLRSEFIDGSNRFDRPGEALFAARDATHGLIGVCGLNVDPYAHDPRVGRVRRLYVHPTHRRHGVGTGLLGALLHHAWRSFIKVRVRTTRVDGAHLYESLGFTVVERDAWCTHELDVSQWSGP